MRFIKQIVVLASIAFLASSVSPQARADGNTYVSDCEHTVVSTHDGETIIVTNDIVTNADYCISVTHDDVTVDCQSHWLTSALGPAIFPARIGISVYGGISVRVQNATVQNCELNNWDIGIYFLRTDSAKAINNKAFENIKGIQADVTSGTDIIGNKLDDNSYAGIYVSSTQTCGVVSGNTAHGGDYGIILGSVGACSIVNNQTNNNERDGILLSFSGSNYLLNNTSNRNGTDGLALIGYSNSNRVENNTTNRNGGYGISDDGTGSNNYFENNVCRNNYLGESDPDGYCK